MIVTWPDFGVSSFRWKKTEQQIAFKSIFGSQAYEIAIPVWEVEMVGAVEKREVARAIDLFIGSIEGYKNQIALWSLTHPVPAGTMRGSMTLSADAAQGATSLSIIASGQNGKTLKAGDYLGVGSGITQQVVQVKADAVADEFCEINVDITSPLRNAFASGSVVEWDKPKALFRLKNLPDGIEYTRALGQPWSLSLREDWRP